MRILEWNINQRANHINTEIIPPFIATAVKDEDPDIFILTEFYKVKRWTEFQDDMEDYNLFLSENSQNHENDVCIGVKKEYEDAQISTMLDSMKDNHLPNFLHITVEVDGRVLSVMGVRIRVPLRKDIPAASEENQHFRLEQLEALENHLAHIPDPVILMGDFNNYRRGLSPDYIDPKHPVNNSKCAVWNMSVIHQRLAKIGYEMHTPEGFSWGSDHCNVKYQCAHDHIFTKGLVLVPSVVDTDAPDRYQGHYIDDFMKLAPEIYHGNGIKGMHTPYPDHKMLVVDFEL